MEYFLAEKSLFEMSTLINFTLHHYYSKTNDWDRFYILSRLGINQEFNKLSIVQLELGWDYEMYFFDIHPALGYGGGLLLSNIDSMDLLLYFRAKGGVIYSLESIWKPLKVGTEASVGVGVSLLNKYKFSLIFMSKFFIEFEF